MCPETLTQSSDAELAAGVRAGDEACFRVLHARHGPQLYRVVIRVLGGDSTEADDVVQETWLRALRALAGFRWESAFSSWLIGIGINQARDALRRRSRSFTADADGSRTDRLRARTAPIGERIDLERAVALLPARRRTVLVLHDIEGYAHEEIGAMLGITVGTSKSQLFHARRSLRALLEPGRRGRGRDVPRAEQARRPGASGPARLCIRPHAATAAGRARLPFRDPFATQPRGLSA